MKLKLKKKLFLTIYNKFCLGVTSFVRVVREQIITNTSGSKKIKFPNSLVRVRMFFLRLQMLYLDVEEMLQRTGVESESYSHRATYA